MLLFAMASVALLAADNNLFALVASGLFFLAVMTAVFWGNWKKYMPKGFVFFCSLFFLWIPLGVTSALKSTFPSSAPRKQIVGRLAWNVKHGRGKGAYYTFGVLLEDGGERAFMEGATAPLAHGQAVAVTYLDENDHAHDPRAISVDILSGQRAGYHDSVNADWFGTWLGVPMSFAGGVLFLVLASRHLRTKSEPPETNPDDASPFEVAG